MKLVANRILAAACFAYSLTLKHNRSEMVAVLGPYEALPYYIHTYIFFDPEDGGDMYL
jgi:hypothetical protein